MLPAFLPAWPRSVDWQSLQFGVEIEFVGAGDAAAVDLLPGWTMALDERQIDETGRESGAELKPGKIRWAERVQIREMLTRLHAHGVVANWSCGVHVHVGLEPWGEAIVPALLDAALSCQGALQTLLRTTEHRLVFCPPVTPAMRQRYASEPVRASLLHRGRPESHRCGVNLAAWFDFGTVEIRFANGSLDYDEVTRTIELCLRFVAAVGEGRVLSGDAAKLAALLGAPTDGYPPPATAPLWHLERLWLDDALIPVLAPLAEAEVPGGEILHIRPVPEGLLVTVEQPDNALSRLLFRPAPTGWERCGPGKCLP